VHEDADADADADQAGVITLRPGQADGLLGQGTPLFE
jgi:hypothetical protein